MISGPTRYTRTDTLVLYTTRVRSGGRLRRADQARGETRGRTLALLGLPDQGAPAAAVRGRVVRGLGRPRHRAELPRRHPRPALRLRSSQDRRRQQPPRRRQRARSEEHTSELQSLMRISYAAFCLNTKHSLISKSSAAYIYQ